MLDWNEIDEDATNNEIWDTYPSYPAPQMTHAAHPITPEDPPGYEGTTSRHNYFDAVENGATLPKSKPKEEDQPSLPVYRAGPSFQEETQS